MEVEQPTMGHEDNAAVSRQVLTRPPGTFLTSGPPEDMDGATLKRSEPPSATTPPLNLTLRLIGGPSPSPAGGSVNGAMPVTWAATLGRGTPCVPELRTGSSPVSLSGTETPG